MASKVLQVRLEEELHTKVADIYAQLGIDLQTAVRIFFKRSVMEKGLPFSMTLTDQKETRAEAAHRAMRSMSDAAEQAGLSDMSLEEINAEIDAVRRARKADK